MVVWRRSPLDLATLLSVGNREWLRSRRRPGKAYSADINDTVGRPARARLSTSTSFGRDLSTACPSGRPFAHLGRDLSPARPSEPPFITDPRLFRIHLSARERLRRDAALASSRLPPPTRLVNGPMAGDHHSRGTRRLVGRGLARGPGVSCCACAGRLCFGVLRPGLHIDTLFTYAGD